MQEKIPHTRHYVQVGDRLVHYRRTGSGPAIVMQHASPLTSESLMECMSIFADHFTCIALDNPGYGLSDPLPEIDRGNLQAYAAVLRETIRALEMDKPVIYGASTGGTITHMFGCLYPDDASMLMLDTYSHMDTQDTAEGYFPDIVPRADGSQFLAYWNKLTRLFIYKPWQRSNAERRQYRDLPSPEVIHAMLMQQLSAGTGYKDLYHAAIVYEDEENIPNLKAQTTVNVWKAAPSYKNDQKYLKGTLPENYIPIQSELGPGGRYNHQLAWLLEHGFGAGSDYQLAPVPQATRRHYVDTALGQVHVRRSDGPGEPVLLLHDWGRSSLSFENLTKQIGNEVNLIAPDLPGHADTPAEVSGRETAMEEMISALEDVLDQLGAKSCSIIGIGAGILLGAALKSRRANHVRKVVCLATAPIRMNEEDCQSVTINAPDLSPVSSGAHVVAAFDMARSGEAFWQWEVRKKEMALARPKAMDAHRMHQTTIDILRSDYAWRDLPSVSAAWIRRTPKLTAPLNDAVVFIPDWQVGEKALADVLPTVLRGEKILLPQDEDIWGTVIREAINL